MVVYNKRFLVWLGLSLFLCKLSSRQTGFPVQHRRTGSAAQPQSLAGTTQDSRPVNKTLEYLLKKSGRPHRRPPAANGPALDPHEGPGRGALQGRFVVLIDGSGYLVFRSRHCDHCLTQRHGERTLYMHQVLEAKLLGPAGTVVSIATEFIDNSDVSGDRGCEPGATQAGLRAEALRRLMAGLRAEFPQLRVCLNGDSLYACGEGFQIAKDYKCDYIYVFKPGRTPALWQDFQELLLLCPDQRVELTTPRGVRRSIAGSTT